MHVQLGFQTKDLLDCSNMYVKPQLSYQALGTLETFNCHFCLYVFHSTDLWYCEQCFNSKNCFGCVGLRNKQFCIFNRQFSKSEYEKEVAKIISKMQKTGEWGQFFPVEISPFPYNDSVAHGYFPLSKSDVSSCGWKWGDRNSPLKSEAKKSSFLKEDLGGFKIPEKISDVSDDILSEVLACDLCTKNYKLQKMELDFYRKMKLPIPRICPDCRYASRMKLRNPRQLFPRKCDECAVEISSPFSPDSPERILCEKCFLSKINR